MKSIARFFRSPKEYRWKPKKDITVYELALCVPIFSSHSNETLERDVLNLPENVRRHFEELK